MPEKPRNTLTRNAVLTTVLVGVVTIAYQECSAEREAVPGSALAALGELSIKGRAPTTGYSREEFGTDWSQIDGCDTRNYILARDLTQDVLDDDDCTILRGVLHDPYTGKTIKFERGVKTSGKVPIDHVVSLSDAWQTGAQQLDIAERTQFANDPLELLAVDGSTNESKGDNDAASWLPPNKSYRCEYIARQVAVKDKYDLWVTPPEYDAMEHVLLSCPDQPLPIR